MDDGNCTCGHPWGDHYDCMYCLEDNCLCGPCTACGENFVEKPKNYGICPQCKPMSVALRHLFESDED